MNASGNITGGESVTRFIEKSNWGKGPWQSEPDRVEWRYLGLPCLIVRSPGTGALCGYVGVAPGHPWHGRRFADIDASVHGGLSYGAPCDDDGPICHVPRPGEPAEVYWVGFDCAHGWDVSPALGREFAETLAYCGAVYRELAYVRHEVESLAEQALAAGVAP